MTGIRLRLAVLAGLIGGPATAQDIGSWTLICPADARGEDARAEVCLLRHRVAILPPGAGGLTATLEVLRRGGHDVPAIALRGLPASVGSVLALQAHVGLRFDAAPRWELSCGPGGATVVCTPAAEAAAGAASQLASARTALVQAQLSVPGVVTLPELSRSLDLQDTAAALARLRASAPAEGPAPALPGLDWRGYLDRLLRAAGLGG